MRRHFTWLRHVGRLRDEVGRQELMVFGGLALLAFGVSKLSVPAAYMVAGGGLLVVGLLGTFFTKRGE